MDKMFLNKEAAADVMAQPARESLFLLHLDGAQTDASMADATGGEPVFVGNKGVGRVTSGAYGYSVGMSLALAYVKGVGPGDVVDVMVLGRPHKATILDAPPFDADGTRLRG